MSDWPRVIVGGYVKRRNERVQITPGVEYDTMGVRWYGKGAYMRPPSCPNTRTLGIAREGDFVFCRIDAQNGPFAVVPTELDGALVTNEFPLYSVDSSSFDPQFLIHCFSRQSTLHQIGKRRDGRDGRARWKEPDFEGWTVPIPPKEVQEKIVEVVSVVDEVVSSLEVEQASAKTARAALLDRLIQNLGEKVTRATLSDVADWTSGGTPKADNPLYYAGEIPWAIIGDVRGRYVRDTTRQITREGLDSIGGAKKMVPAGSVLVTMYGTIGHSAISAVPMATNQAICCGVPKKRVSADYLRLWVSAHESDLVLLGEGKTQQNISKRKIQSFPISYPDSEAQKRIVDIMATVEDQIDALEQEVGRTIQMRTALVEALLARDIEAVPAESVK